MNIAALQARIKDLETAIGAGNNVMAQTFKLPPKLLKLMALLVATPVVTADMIHRNLDIATDAKVAVHRLRTHLEPWGIEVHSRRYVGYWLSDETKDKISALITPRVTIPEGEVPATAAQGEPADTLVAA